MSRRYRDTGPEYTVTTTKNGISTTVTKRETQEHCEECDAVIPGNRYEEIEVWLNYNCEGSESDIMAFCSYKCLSDWASKKEITKSPLL